MWLISITIVILVTVGSKLVNPAKHSDNGHGDNINIIGGKIAVKWEEHMGNGSRIMKDFIVVGAGSAGRVLANSLTEVSKWSVLILQAGDDETDAVDILILADTLQQTDVDWQYKTVPSNKACLDMDNRQCNYPRGKVMGGTRVLNAMIYTRGNRRDYDHWETLGNTGWGYANVLQYFKKSEDMIMKELAEEKVHHSTGGYMTINYSPYRTPIADAFLAAGEETGQPRVD